MRGSSYRPRYYLQTLANDGAVATARKLVLVGRTHEGFARLWELDVLDRSIEAAMIRPEFSELFTADELEAAGQDSAQTMAAISRMWRAACELRNRTAFKRVDMEAST